MISGIGHSTTFLYDAVRKHPHYQALQVEGRPESHILADIAEQFLANSARSHRGGGPLNQLRRKRVVYPPVIGRAWAGLPSGVVIQDPTMQRRTMATLPASGRRHRRSRSGGSYPGCSPRLENSAAGLRFSGDDSGLWPVGRYLALLLGELPRLLDNAQGYGPNGKGFITHVDFHAMLAWRGNACVKIRY